MLSYENNQLSAECGGPEETKFVPDVTRWCRNGRIDKSMTA